MRCTIIALLSGLLSIAQANAIIFFEINTCNSGVYASCSNIGPGVYCAVRDEGAAAIQISKGPLDFATMWSGGGCSIQQCVRVLLIVVSIILTVLLLSNRALVVKDYFAVSGIIAILTGGLFNTLGAPKQEDPQSAVNCTGKMDANVFGHASDVDGAWEIRAEHVKDSFAGLYDEFKTVALDEKMEWLQTHGAVHRAQLHDGSVSLALAFPCNLY